MNKKPLKSWRTLASDSKARRKAKPTEVQIEKLNKIFEDIEKEKVEEIPKNKIARQPEV